MKKNYTLKITLAMLFVVLVSLVSFVGVYKGKNLVKDYSFGKDFSNRKVAVFSVKEETTTQNDTEIVQLQMKIQQVKTQQTKIQQVKTQQVKILQMKTVILKIKKMIRKRIMKMQKYNRKKISFIKFK